MVTFLPGRDAGAAAKGTPPPAPKKATQTEYFGTAVPDPYRWMEQTDDPEVQAWLTAQNQYTRAVLGGLRNRDQLLRRVQELSASTVEIDTFARVGDRNFYLKRPVNSNKVRLYVREGAHGAERLLVDPDRGDAGSQRTIDAFAPSYDGKLVAYCTSVAGTENTVIEVVDVDSGVVGKDRVEHVLGEPQWRGDHRAFFYSRLQQLPSDAPATSKFQKVKTYLHVLGSNQRDDVAVLGFGVSSGLPVGPADSASLFSFYRTPWIAVRLSRAGDWRREFWVAREQAVVDGKATWRKVATFDDEVSMVDARGDDLFLLSMRDAPGGKVVRVNMEHGLAADGEVVVPPSANVLQAILVARDALYVRAQQAGVARLLRAPYGDGAAAEVTLPFSGSITLLATDPGTDGALFKMQSWVRAPAIYSSVPGSDVVVDSHLLPTADIDVTAFESTEVEVPSTGGVNVPLSIVHKRGMKLDGTAPTWLSVYGSYGLSSEPRFEPRRIAWLEEGGVYAVCHARGGRERGEAWHKAAMKQNKQATIDDAIACARHLIAQKYTSAAHLGIEGTSAGGVAAGGALTQHPELFGAAILRVPIVDTIGLERAASGAVNAKEFGSPKVADELPALLATSPYQRVRDGVRYPAVLLLAGTNDRRVPIWQPAKMAARLQAANSSGKPVLLRIESDAGHGLVGATRTQVDTELADIYAFLRWQLTAAHPRKASQNR